MENREYAVYGYQVDDKMRNLIIMAVASAFITMAFVATISPWCLLLLFVPVGIAIQIKRGGYDKPLLIGSRYLIIGEKIIYYKNVSQAILNKEKQVLTLVADKGKIIEISADKFPTNARKPDKIRINKTAKFEKVSERIIDKLKTASPQLVV